LQIILSIVKPDVVAKGYTEDVCSRIEEAFTEMETFIIDN
jgi:nucleoside diphosphate kinase